MQPSLMVVRNRIGWLAAAGDKSPVTLRLLVKDFKDRGFSGVEWDIVRKGAGELSISGATNGNGTSVAHFETSEPTFTVRVHLPEGMVTKDMSVEDAAHDVMTLRSVEEAPQAILNTVELVAGVSGLIFFGLGLATKFPLIERVGEVLIVATVFTRIGRAV